ncbi:NADH:flavin oxidoreductase [Chenggangzhangella methanolivorans]|uniref:NADH:flavin oxidoreductase n=1 Tax=Chenggangzhangella methanolivorans TaxID=1437009 RepID=A0A9E6UNV5_9HYPH|nr:NADH:flavin oxidoreductase [Chenggangzhangella methanolivorans]QZO00679.1 NADH:flavin oxidoreductase [Chenggangzhangella methanolivorans]
MSNDTLFTKFDIKEMTLRNRFAVAPMTRVSATADGFATERIARYYERFAQGGFGLVITEGLYTDQAHAQGYLHQPGLADEDQALSWAPVVEAVRRHGARLVAQLMHAGALSQGNRFRPTTIGPSAIQPMGEQMAFYRGQGRYPAPSEITEEQIADAVEGFAASAARAVTTAGFDGIEIHGANGYLLDQFLTDHTNRRTDRWGGDTRRRMELTLAVFRVVRERVGGAVPVGVRISQGKVNDFAHKWAGGEADAEAIFGALGDAGADYIHVTEHEAWRPAFEGGDTSLAALARRYAPNAAIIANGGLSDLAQAAKVIGEAADLVSLGKGALANPDLPNRAREGRAFGAFDPAILGPVADVKDRELAA